MDDTNNLGGEMSMTGYTVDGTSPTKGVSVKKGIKLIEVSQNWEGNVVTHD